MRTQPFRQFAKEVLGRCVMQYRLDVGLEYTIVGAYGLGDEVVIFATFGGGGIGGSGGDRARW